MYEAIIKAVKELIGLVTAYLLGKKTEQVKNEEKSRKIREKARRIRNRVKSDSKYRKLLDTKFRKTK